MSASAPSTPLMAYLILQFEGGWARRVALNKDLIVIGRSASCDVQIVDDRISRRHCQVSQHEGQWILDDLDSRNKTWVGLQPVDQLVLTDGDEFRIGGTYILFRAGEMPSDDSAEQPNAR